MTREILLLGMIRERAGTSTVTLELPGDATVGTVRSALANRLPELAPLIPACAIAVGHHYRNDADAVGEPGVEIAVVPPVSGG